MQSDLKTVGWWTIYAVVLLLLSGTLYKTMPQPPGPLVSVEANPPRFEAAGTVEIRFRLSRPASAPLTIPYDLEGDAKRGTDYDLADPVQDTVIVRPGEQASPPVILKKTAPATTGDGAQETTTASVVVALRAPAGSAGSFRLDPRASRVELPIEVVRPHPTAETRLQPAKATDVPNKNAAPEPAARLVWSVDPSSTLDRRAASTVRLRVTLNRPISDPVTVGYTATFDPDLVFEGPPAGPDGRREITLAPGTVSAEHEFKFPADDAVGGPTRRVRLEPAGVTPKAHADTAELAPLEINTADDQPLGGHALVLVIYSADLAANGQAMINELKTMQDRNREQLVGGSLYLLAGDKAIYRLPTDAEALGKRESFARDADHETILNAAVERVQSRIDSRAVDKAETILVWQDTSETAKAGVDQRTFVGLPDLTWQLVWIGPPRDQSKRAAALEKVFRPMLGRPKFLRLEQAEGQLAGALGTLVRGGR
jgi:hypothetical protein